jgi:hypothetical protein
MNIYGFCPLALPTEWMSSEVTKSWISLRTPSCKTTTTLTGDRCFAQAQVFECLNGSHTLLLFPLVSLQPAQGLKLNRKSISELEPEMPLTHPSEVWRLAKRTPYKLVVEETNPSNIYILGYLPKMNI